MRITGQALLDDLKILLLDPNEVIWDADKKVSGVNEALNFIAFLRPDATAKTETFALTANSPKQEIPSSGLRFLDLVRNIGGSPIRQISRKDMDDAVPTWTQDETGTAIEHFMFDEENPTVFYVYPVPTTRLKVELVFSTIPGKFTADTNDFPIASTFETPVKEFVLYRCLAMEGKGQDIVKAASHLKAFYNALGVKLQNDAILTSIQGAK